MTSRQEDLHGNSSETHFCPVVFFSANALPDGFPSGTDPFARYLNKNEKEPKDVAATIESFIPHVLGLESIRAEIEKKYARSLQKVSSLIWKSETDPEERNQAMLRVTRRRLAATLEHPLNEEKHIKAWEQFIYPPVDDDLCTGDVIVQKYANRLNANSFRVILTPPCDLVTAPGRNPVESVLLGKCIPVNDPEVIRVCSLTQTQSDRLPSQLGKKLREDKLDSKLVLPKMADLWPAMVLDFKSLELVERNSIAPSLPATIDYKFERIASMDSPFREALSWRFTHSIGRPGYPAIDQASLATDVEAAATRRQ